jgi:hypothetical protein
LKDPLCCSFAGVFISLNRDETIGFAAFSEGAGQKFSFFAETGETPRGPPERRISPARKTAGQGFFQCVCMVAIYRKNKHWQ